MTKTLAATLNLGKTLISRIVIMAALAPLYFYRLFISPLLGANCRFSPSCSAYAIAAIQLHGVVKGGYLAAERICRCHPLGGAGYDPPPKHEAKHKANYNKDIKTDK